jgi:hypothetical protein
MAYRPSLPLPIVQLNFPRTLTAVSGAYVRHGLDADAIDGKSPMKRRQPTSTDAVCESWEE